MSCFHKRPKRTKSEEQAFQEQVRKVAQENGKRLGKSPKGATVSEQTDARSLFCQHRQARAHTHYCLDNLDLGRS